MRAATYVNHGRWVVECDAADCRGAIDVSQHLSAAGIVCDCQDRTACYHQTDPCGHIIRIDWPGFRTELWRILAVRPDPITRNWLPGETVEDLKAENLLHGMRV